MALSRDRSQAHCARCETLNYFASRLNFVDWYCRVHSGVELEQASKSAAPCAVFVCVFGERGVSLHIIVSGGHL